MDNKEPATTPDGGGELDSEEGSEDRKRDWEAEAREARKRRDSALKRAQLAEGKIKEYETRLAEMQAELEEVSSSKTTTTSGEDVEQLREQFKSLKEKLKTRETEFQQKEQQLNSQVNDYIVKDRVTRLAADLVLPEALEDFFRLNRDQFTVERDDKGHVSVSTRTGASVEEFIQEYLDERPYMAKARRKPGMGTNNTQEPASGDKSTVDLDRLLASGAKLTKEQFAKDPKLAREYLKRFQLK